jgi:hypothetical protein
VLETQKDWDCPFLISWADSVDTCFLSGILNSSKCNGKPDLGVSGGLGSSDSQMWSFVLWYYCSSSVSLIKSSDIACGRACICLNVGSCGSRNVWHADPLGFASQPSAGGVVTSLLLMWIRIWDIPVGMVPSPTNSSPFPSQKLVIKQELWWSITVVWGPF